VNGPEVAVIPNADCLESDADDAASIEILDRAKRRLDASPCLPLHELKCRFADGALEVRGMVPTSYAKRLALACLTCIEGVQMIVDSIGVQFPGA
jgi:hypothetical protein